MINPSSYVTPLIIFLQLVLLTMQSAYNLQSLTFSPQLIELRRKLIQPSVLSFPETHLNHIDTDKLKIKQKRSNSQQFAELEFGKEIIDSMDMKTSKAEDRLKQKEKEIRARIERNLYVLPPLRNYQKINRTYTQNKIDSHELVNSYINKNMERYQTPTRKELLKNKQEHLQQISIFLKRTKSRNKSNKIVYYNPDQVKRASLQKQDYTSLQSLRIKHFDSQLKLKKRQSIKRKRTKTELKARSTSKEFNFFEIETQFTQQLYSTFQSIYHLNKDMALSGLKKVPFVPRQEDLKAFLNVYEPVNEEIGIKSLLKSNFCSVQFGKHQVYVGEMVGKIRSGIGILFRQGHCYEGQWKNNQIIKGVQITKDGIYKGTFHENKKNREGEMQWCNGQIYTGQWSKGLQHGNGLWINTRGESYKGDWRNGKPEGIGSLVIKNSINSKSGRRFKGSFVNGKQHGFGRETFANGDTFQGIYREDKPFGKGTYKWMEGSIYEGEFYQGNREGMGQLNTSFKLIYRGQYRNDRPQGQCEIIMPNGDTYYGMVKNGKKNGKGTLRVRRSKEVFNGYWKDDFFVNNQESTPKQ